MIKLLMVFGIAFATPYSIEFTTNYGKPVVIIRNGTCDKVFEVSQKDVDEGNVDKIVAYVKQKYTEACNAR